MSKYADWKDRYPEDLTLNEMRTILHISKRKVGGTGNFFACLVFTLTAPLYIWSVVGM